MSIGLLSFGHKNGRCFYNASKNHWFFFPFRCFVTRLSFASVQSLAEKRQVARLHYSRKNWHDWYNLKIFQNGITLGCVYKWACSILSVSTWSELRRLKYLSLFDWVTANFSLGISPMMISTSILDPILQIILHLDAIKWGRFNRQLTSWLITPVALGPSLIYTF